MSERTDPQNPEQPSQPPETKAYPDPPYVQSVKAEGTGPDTLRTLRVTVEYHSHRGSTDPRRSTVHFHVVDNATAELRDVEGGGKLIDQLSAIETACEAVLDHPVIEAVNGLPEITEQATEYIRKCEEKQDDD